MSDPKISPASSPERAAGPQAAGEPGTPDASEPGTLDAGQFAETFADKWPGVPPAGTQLRLAAHDRWVRIHTLPEGRRIPTGPDDYATILDRHHAVLAALSGDDGSAASGNEYVVVAHSWSREPDPVVLDEGLAAALPDAQWWRSQSDDSDLDAPIHRHAYVASADAAALDAVLRLTADDAAHDAIVTDRTASWLYHPYDGGGDMVVATPERARDLRARFSAWTSSRPDGL